MTSQADVIVIGSGGLGAAIPFHLVKRGVKHVALVDRHDIGSQTSPRAAGMVSCARKSDLMTNLIKLAAERIKRFTEDTGQPLHWVHSGSLKVARREQDAEVIENDITRGRRLGLDLERISAQEAHGLNPFLEPEGVVAVMRVGDDMYFDPHRLPSVSRGAPKRAGRRCNPIPPSRGSLSTMAKSRALTLIKGGFGRRSSSMRPERGRAKLPRRVESAFLS